MLTTKITGAKIGNVVTTKYNKKHQKNTFKKIFKKNFKNVLTSKLNGVKILNSSLNELKKAH